jgi:hypothetical protein
LRVTAAAYRDETRLIIPDGLSMSCAIVSPSIGCKKIGVTEDQDIFIVDNPENFARNIIGLWRDNALREKNEIRPGRWPWRNIRGK